MERLHVKRLCHKDWQRQFPFPRSVSRDQICRIGYDSDDFNLTMDQEQILTLLSGENLYKSNDVFVRELLQNAIDATLLRAQMDPHFNLNSDDAAIYLWEGLDEKGNYIFRIDDHGTGMTRGMLKRYFLKVGNSYYNSDELKRDLQKHNCNDLYHANSRFGIGFLSCFLCATCAEISTLYFDDYKSQEEYEPNSLYSNEYGLRMDITGLRGYYTLRNQALNHIIDESLPYPQEFQSLLSDSLEVAGYRYKPGTSISLKLDSRKLGNCNIKQAIESYICGTKMPVYYNGYRIGRTYSELMETANRLSGEITYQLTEKEKKLYDMHFPAAQGNYPAISVTTTILDKAQHEHLPGLSGIVVQYKVYYTSVPKWTVKDQVYTINAHITTDYATDQKVLSIRWENIKSFVNYNSHNWRYLERMYGSKALENLAKIFKNYSSCPPDPASLGEVWRPFSETLELTDAWKSFIDYEYVKDAHLFLELDAIPKLSTISHNPQCYNCVCSYQSIICGNVDESYSSKEYDALFYLENDIRPIVDVGRVGITRLPLEVNLAICGIMLDLNCSLFNMKPHISSTTDQLPKWRELRSSKLGKWLIKTLEHRGNKIIDELKEPQKKDYYFSLYDSCYSNVPTIYCFFIALLQDSYRIYVNYETGQTLSFIKRADSDINEAYDLFPPLMFCEAASDESRKLLCSAEYSNRRCITADHPFSKWLIENAFLLNKHFPQQFNQIIQCLRIGNADEIITVVSNTSNQVSRLSEIGGIHISSCPILKESDFWKSTLTSL